MNDQKSITTDEGDIVRWFEKDVNNYLDQTTLLFGASYSGKTTVIEEILYLTRDHIPNYIVVANENSRKAYKNKLPPKCIKKDLSKKKLQDIWERQSSVTQLYDTANDINILELLFKRMPDRESIVLLHTLNKKAAECVQVIETSANLNFAQKKSQKTAIEDLQIKKIKDLYKNTIRKNRSALESLDLSPHENIALEYLDLNPRIMIILDDVTDRFQKWMNYFKRGEINPFESIFYQGRHNYITLVFGAHDDKIVDTELRKNSRTTIYLTSQAIMTSVEKKSNGFTAKEKKVVGRIAAKLFQADTNGIKTYQKLCYIREDMFPFRYTIANLYPDFNLGCDPLRELANKMPQKTTALSENKFAKDIMKGKK